MPEVSIVLPVRNAAHTLDECLDSIARQSLKNYEVLVVDDGSTDASVAKVRGWAKTDKRIRLIAQPATGIVSALNRGLDEARAPLIARMDADDRMYADRLLLQADYLQQYAHIGLVSCQVKLFPESSIQAGYREYVRWQNACLSTDDIAHNIYVESPFAHPSVMFRRQTVQDIGAYRQGDFPEDYDLWLRLSQAGVQMSKLPQVLLDWRESENRLSRVDPRCSRAAFDRLRATYLAKHLQRILALKKRALVCWGAGRITRRRTNLLIEKGFSPAAWIDIDVRKIGNRLSNVPVVAPDWLRQQKPFVLSYVANHGARDEIAHCLCEMGYRRGEDYLMVG